MVEDAAAAGHDVASEGPTISSEGQGASQSTSALIADMADMAAQVGVVTLAGDHVASLDVGPTDTLDHVQQRLDALIGARGPRRLIWRGQLLRPCDVLAQLGVKDGDTLELVRMSAPAFELVSDNAELLDGGKVARVLESASDAWGWATVCTEAGCRQLTVRLGATGPREANDTDYFIGAVPGDAFDRGSAENQLGSGIALVLSAHSSFSGSISSDYSRNPLGARQFVEGDLVSVELDPDAGAVRFRCGGRTSQPFSLGLPPETLAGVRLAVSMYCRTSDGRVRSVESCVAESDE